MQNETFLALINLSLALAVLLPVAVGLLSLLVPAFSPSDALEAADRAADRAAEAEAASYALPLWMHVRADLVLWIAAVHCEAGMCLFRAGRFIRGNTFPGEKALFTALFIG